MAKSVKAVRPMTSFAHSDGKSDDLLRPSRAAQGNIANSVTNRRNYWRDKSLSAVGGTRNNVRAMFAPADTKLCRVVTRNIVSTNVGPSYDREHIREFSVPQSVNHNYAPDATPVAAHNLDTLLRRAERMDMTLVEYCEFLNITL